MYPVVVSDLDGTLLNQNHELAPRTLDVIRRLSAQGTKFVFATGRHHVDVKDFREQLGIKMYMITCNGARVHNPEDEAIIRHDVYPEHVGPLVALGRQYKEQVFTSVYQEDNWFVEQYFEKMEEFSDENGFHYTMINLDDVPTKAVAKVFYMAEDHESLLQLEKDILEQFGEQVSVTFSLPNCLEVMAPGVCKGVALAEVLKLKGYEFKDTVAFGDGLNDYEMLAEVGKGLLMGNADQRLRAKLPDNEVIGHCNDDAVADYLEKQLMQ
ncbi:MAG: Cof-type HAD-IIB family hydrolase [Endozoicomonas sp.]